MTNCKDRARRELDDQIAKQVAESIKAIRDSMPDRKSPEKIAQEHLEDLISGCVDLNIGTETRTVIENLDATFLDEPQQDSNTEQGTKCQDTIEYS